MKITEKKYTIEITEAEARALQTACQVCYLVGIGKELADYQKPSKDDPRTARELRNALSSITGVHYMGVDA